MTSIKAILCLAILGVPVSPAFAGCVVPTFAFFPERNDNVVVTALFTPGTPCVHKLGEGPSYRFTSIKPILEPEHGSLSIVGHATITYQPKKAFSGKDAYGVQACAAKKGGQGGCSTLFFVMMPK